MFQASHSTDSKSPSVEIAPLKQVTPDNGHVSLRDLSPEALHDLTRYALEGPGRVDTLMHLFGLLRCKDTWAGNRQTRGISGGERKRLSTVELLTGQQRVLILDEISTGLVCTLNASHIHVVLC
jgi:ABC-type glutathione transport system ATPase component